MDASCTLALRRCIALFDGVPLLVAHRPPLRTRRSAVSKGTPTEPKIGLSPILDREAVMTPEGAVDDRSPDMKLPWTVAEILRQAAAKRIGCAPTRDASEFAKLAPLSND